MPNHKLTLPLGLREHGALLFLLLIAAVWLYRSPFSASNLEVSPDSVEYALAPLRVLESGRYEIILEGRPLPPRYPPWFSTLVILPAYVLFGHDPGNSILPVTVMAVAGVGFAWAVGKRLSGSAGGIIAGLGLISLPSYSSWAVKVMSDVPATTLMLATWLLYFRIRAGSRSVAIYLMAGLLVAIDALFRPVFAAMLFPFLLEILRARRAILRNTVALLVPITGAFIATMAYNSAVFGSAFRNGYNFWVTIPMDYPSLTFSLGFLWMNLWVVGRTVFPLYLLACLLAWLAVRKREPAALTAARPAFWDAWTFVGLTTVPILLFHLIYFFPSNRFHLPMFAGVVVIFGGMCGLLFQSRTTLLLNLLLPVLLVLAIAARIAGSDRVPHRRLAADRVRAHTPDNAIIISGIDPVYLERLAAHRSSRRIVPISRNVEYASKVLTLKRGRSEQAVKFVASEQLDALVAQASTGTPLFLDATMVSDEADSVNQLQQRFAFFRRAPFLYELRLR